MRPCNQCGQPVENDAIVCAACEESNRETGYKPKVSVRPFGPDNQPMDPEPEYSTSLGQIGNVFVGLCAILGGLVGYVIAGDLTVVIGFIVVGAVMSFLMFRMMI